METLNLFEQIKSIKIVPIIAVWLHQIMSNQ